MRGVIYVAYGGPSIRCLARSVEALRRWEPGVQVLVVSDREVKGVHTVVGQTEDVGARSVKTRLPEYVPVDWTQVVYLDVDTLPLRPFTRFWSALDVGWDVVLCRDETAASVDKCRLKHLPEVAHTVTVLGTRKVAQFAGGLMAWTVKTVTEKFFRVWHEEWRRYKYRDQGALTRALARVPLKMWVLEYQANAKHRVEAVEVWHQHGMARRRGSP